VYPALADFVGDVTHVTGIDLLLGRRCGSGDEKQDRGAEYVGSVFQSRREAKAIITPDELGVTEG
jgi:hypothetical protein